MGDGRIETKGYGHTFTRGRKSWFGALVLQFRQNDSSAAAWGLMTWKVKLLVPWAATWACCRMWAVQSTNTAADIPPLNPPLPEIPPTFLEEHGTAMILAGVAVLAVLSAIIYFLLKPRPRPPVPPEDEARAALEPLRTVPETGRVLSQVSQTLRHYFTSAFGLPPVEMTTTDFALELKGSENVGPELGEATIQLLCECDEHKFAPNAPTVPLQAVERAAMLVEKAHARRMELRQKAGAEAHAVTVEVQS